MFHICLADRFVNVYKKYPFTVIGKQRSFKFSAEKQQRMAKSNSILPLQAANSQSNVRGIRSTQRAQTSLAEADHYSHIAHDKNIEPWLWKTTHPLKKKKGSGSLPARRSGYVTTITVFSFAHLLILQYPDHHQNLISSSLYYSRPVHKTSSQSIHNFLSNVVHRQTNRQTDRQTDKLTNATKNITSFAKEVMILGGSC